MIRVLCSGTALGHFIPGLLVRDALRRLGQLATTEVYEAMLSQEQRRLMERTARRYRQRFELALLGQRLATGGMIEARSPEETIRPILHHWQEEGVDHLILLSGQWVPIAAAYAQLRPDTRVELLHIDASSAPSWSASSPPSDFQHVWLASAEAGRVEARLPVHGLVPTPWSERDRCVVCHGGGWGLGSYRDRAEAILAAGFEVEMVVHERDDLEGLPSGFRGILADPAWRPWMRTAGEHTFPPLLGADGSALVADGPYQPLLDRIRTARAVISKPGGATLVDSMSTATPVVFLEPCGEHEMANARLWTDLGLGLGYDAWVDGGFDSATLRASHRRLLDLAAKLPVYPAARKTPGASRHSDRLWEPRKGASM